MLRVVVCCAFFIAGHASALSIWGRDQFPTYANVEDSLIVVDQVHHVICQRDDALAVRSTFEIRLPDTARDAGELLIQRQTSALWSDEADVVLNGASIDGVWTAFEAVTGTSVYRLHLPNDQRRHAKLILTYSLAFHEASSLAFNGLALFHPGRLVARDHEFGWDIRQLSGFSSDTPVRTSLKVEPLANYFVLSSAPLVDGEFPLQEIANLAVFFGSKDAYKKLAAIDVDGTHFDFVTRLSDSAIDLPALADTVRDAWPKFISSFGRATSYVAIIEQDGGIGAGPVGTNMLGILTSNHISPSDQAGMRLVTGWEGPLDSTRSIVETLYKDSPTPLYEYFSNILTHELGHLYFGFGMTQERATEAQEFWFSLGLGIVYDSQISSRRFGRDPAVYQSLAEQLATFEANSAIDQHLIHPDTTRDLPNGVYPFNRVQDYAHLKSARVLRTLRDATGAETFDRLVRRYLRKGERAHGYDTFRPMLDRQLPDLEALERQLQI